MSDELPDVLDTMGRTPREFGSVHVHFEGLRVVDGRRSVATVLVQTAFTPAAGAVLQVIDQGQSIATTLVPSLDDGRVVRLYLPCVRCSDEPALTLLVEAEAPSARAVRVRPAWKLFDTLEIPRLSEMDPVHGEAPGINLASSIAITAVAGPLLGAVVIQMGSSASLDPNRKTKVHPAQQLPSLTAGVLEGVALPLDAVREEVLWRRGQPVPEAPPPTPIVRHEQQPAPTGGVRWCRSCGFEGTMRNHGTARSCPRCDEPWF